MKFKLLTVIAILLSLYMVKTFWKETPTEAPRHVATVGMADSQTVDGLDAWAYENPLDLNYALIQRRIDSILNGERDIASSEKLLREDAEFLMLLTQISPPLSPVFFLLGQVELLLQNYSMATRALTDYVSLEPKNIWGWKLLALAQLGAKDHTAAIEAFKAVIAINPVDLSAWKGLGKIYADTGRQDLAVAAYKKALLMSPSDPEIQAALK